MRPILAAISFTWWQLLTAITVAAVLSLGACRLQVVLSTDQVAILFGIKVAVIAVVISAILFFYRLLWDDIARMKPAEFPRLVSYYRSSFIMLFIVNILIIISTILDGYVVYFKPAASIQYVSHGNFLSAILFLLAFVLYFFVKVFSELQTVRRAASGKTSAKNDDNKPK